MFKVFVGNLPFSFDDTDLARLMEKAGEIKSAKVIMDRDTGRSRGFGFVEFTDEGGAEEAISRFDGEMVEGRKLNVNEAQDRKREDRDNRSSSGNGGGNRRGGGGGDRGGRRRQQREDY